MNIQAYEEKISQLEKSLAENISLLAKNEKKLIEEISKNALMMERAKFNPLSKHFQIGGVGVTLTCLQDFSIEGGYFKLKFNGAVLNVNFDSKNEVKNGGEKK